MHSVSVTDDGERVYVAGTTAGFYVLDSEAIAHATDAQLAAGTAGCNQRSTIVASGGAIDAAKLPALANDCLHMVVNNDPGLKAFLASNASPETKASRYLVLLTRSRFDVYPPVNATPTGTHSAVFVPNRPARVRGNTKGRPAFVWLSDENGGCPLNYARMVSVEAEATPIMVGAFAIPDNQIEECLDQATTEPNGAAAASRAAAESQPDDLQEPRVHHLVRPRPARDRHLQSVHAARGRLRADHSARRRAHVPGVQGRPDLLGRQRHRPARRALHRTATRRAAGTRARAPTKAMPRALIASGAALLLLSGLFVSARPGAQTRHSDADGAFVCPMHPDYTLDIAGTCPRCGMALVRATPFDVRDYGLELRTTPAARPAGQTGDAGISASGIQAPAKLVHVVRAGARAALSPVRHQPGHGRTSSTFIPSSGRTATWTIDVTLPKAGYYTVLSDFLPQRRRVAAHRTAARHRRIHRRPRRRQRPSRRLTRVAIKVVDDITADASRSIRRRSSPASTATDLSPDRHARPAGRSPTCRRTSAPSDTRSS